MIDKELLEKLDQWHEDNHHQKIIQEIEGLPEELRQQYQLQGRLARALNNTGRYQEALGVLDSIREEGEQDHRWWSRRGYAYYQLDRMEEAKECFLTAQRLDPGNGDAKTFLAWMNVGPSGKANAWDGGASRKETAQGDTANGWTGGDGPARRSAKPETANGWGGQTELTGKRSMGDGGTRNGEGRGWEGTAQLETRLFGSLRFPVKEGLFQAFPLTIGGRSMVADLFIWEELARPERWEALAGLLDRLPEMYRKARERFEADYESIEVIRFFLRVQLQEMDESPLLASLGVSSREEATPERFVQRLELRGVTVAPLPGAQEEMDCTLDFCLDPEITDQLLVFRFTQELELYDISHES